MRTEWYNAHNGYSTGKQQMVVIIIITAYYHYSRKNVLDRNGGCEPMKAWKHRQILKTEHEKCHATGKIIPDINNIRNKKFLPLPAHCVPGTIPSALYNSFFNSFYNRTGKLLLNPRFTGKWQSWALNLGLTPMFFFFNPPTPQPHHLLWLFLFDLLHLQLTPLDLNTEILKALSWTIFSIYRVLGCSSSPLWHQLPSMCAWFPNL